MADPVLTQPPPPPDPNQNPNFSTEFESLPIPPLDSMFLSTQDPTSTNNETFMSDLDLSFDENCDIEFTFDDLDDLYFPSESEPFLIPNQTTATATPTQGYFSNSVSPESVSSEICGDQGFVDVASYLDCPSEHSGSFNPQNSGDASAVRVSNFPSPDSDGCDREFSGGPVSSHGSGVSEATNSPHSTDSANFVVDQKIKTEGIGKISVPKRKKGNEDANGESRSSKYRRSETANANANVNSESVVVNDDDDEKRKARLIRNRESAQLSRQRKKHYVEELEDKVRSMHSTISDLNSKISYFMAENATLRQQLTGGAMCPPPPSGMYPPMAYPWGVPCAPYVVKPQGSQVPLVPIPRLKPQQPVSASKPKKSENKKSEGKTKKVAGVSFLGLLCFVLLFGGLVPIVNVKYGGIRDGVTGGLGYVGNGFYDQHRGRVLTVNGFPNGSDESTGVGFFNGKFDTGNGIDCERGRGGGPDFDVEQKERGSQHLSGSDEFVRLGNASEPLVASLYVPRNDKLVKIDGNLIIHSILASERAVASHEATENKNNRETGLAIPRDLSPAFAIPEVGNNIGRHSHLYRKPTERPKALSSGAPDTSKDHKKSSAADGKLQQWFREGLAGPMLSSGMCTEVFHFDVSPASAAGAIITTSAVANTSAERRQNATHPNKGKNRRILSGLPVPLTGSKLNITGERVRRTSQQDNFQGNKSASSMVVSVLVDPREAGDSDIDGMIAPKSLSRIFVVVLMDSVKYVTYSCVLPRSGPHLVTT